MFGDPRNRWHPVAWIGSAVAWGRTRSAHGGRARLLVAGGVLTLALAGVAAIAAALVTTLARSLGIGGVVIEAVALSALLSVRGLVEAARLVESTLGREDLAAARATVGTHLVSRETAEFDAAQVASAAVESVAENLTDSVLAPICFYLAFGLPGAAVYRVVNTADAMIGYRDDVLEHFGKVAARLDDLLNFVPARLAGIAIVAAAILEGRARHAWRIMRRDARRTASPNAGWPMAAMAGALDVTLEKPATYRLGDGRAPRGEDIGRAVRLIGAATVVGVGAAVLTRIAVALVAG